MPSNLSWSPIQANFSDSNQSLGIAQRGFSEVGNIFGNMRKQMLDEERAAADMAYKQASLAQSDKQFAARMGLELNKLDEDRNYHKSMLDYHQDSLQLQKDKFTAEQDKEKRQQEAMKKLHYIMSGQLDRDNKAAWEATRANDEKYKEQAAGLDANINIAANRLKQFDADSAEGSKALDDNSLNLQTQIDNLKQERENLVARSQATQEVELPAQDDDGAGGFFTEGSTVTVPLEDAEGQKQIASRLKEIDQQVASLTGDLRNNEGVKQLLTTQRKTLEDEHTRALNAREKLNVDYEKKHPRPALVYNPTDPASISTLMMGVTGDPEIARAFNTAVLSTIDGKGSQMSPEQLEAFKQKNRIELENIKAKHKANEKSKSLAEHASQLTTDKDYIQPIMEYLTAAKKWAQDNGIDVSNNELADIFKSVQGISKPYFDWTDMEPAQYTGSLRASAKNFADAQDAYAIAFRTQLLHLKELNNR